MTKKALVLLMAMVLSVVAFAGTASAKAFGAVIVYDHTTTHGHGK